MSIDYIRSIPRIVACRSNARLSPFRGCTDDEVAVVAAACGGRLPAAYVAFLSTMGVSAGPLFRDVVCLFAAVLQVGPEAEEILESSGSTYRLPSDALVFSTYSGYQYMLMRTNEGDDPPVYRGSDTGEAPTLQAPSFSDYLHACVEQTLLLELPSIDLRGRHP